MEGELFQELNGAYQGDTGAGGLNNTSSTAYVRNFFRQGDSDDRGQNWPIIRIEFVRDHRDSFGFDAADMLVKFHIHCKAQAGGFDTQDAVAERVREVYQRVVLSSGIHYGFAALHLRGAGQAPAPDSELHFIVTFGVTATKDA